MNGDLSLSQSLGGLRIANPDDDDNEAIASPTASPDISSHPTRPPGPSSRDSESTITGRPAIPNIHTDAPSSEQQGGFGFNPDAYTLQNTNVSPSVSRHSQSPAASQYGSYQSQSTHSPRMSLPPEAHGQQPMRYPSYTSEHGGPTRSNGQPGPSPRPISAMYIQPNTSSSSHLSSQGSYRYRDDTYSSDGSVNGLGRSGSRSARHMMAGAPTREGSGRVYQQGGSQQLAGNGPLPPRRNSRREKAPAAGGPRYDPDLPYAGSAPMPKTAEEWRERGAATSVRQERDAEGNQQTRIMKKGPKDFNFGRTLGEGSYSTVMAATDRQTLKEYAIKILDKRHIIKEKKVKYVNIERDTLNRLTEHPGVVRLYYTFQDEKSLYFVLDLATGGELLGVLKRMGSFDVECTRFYSAQILDSIAYMHTRGVIHRDLKPENVLLDKDMHVKITDFGTAKILSDPKATGSAQADAGDPLDGADSDRAVSFVGTAEYVSPELLRDKNACKASDLWALGCIMYQLLAGRPPFKAANEYLTFQKILALEYTFPEGFPPVARDLIERLLVLEPANRLPVEHVKNHQFFDGTQWGKLLWRQKAPRLKAYEPPAAQPIRLNGNGAPNGNAAYGAVSAGNPMQPMQSAPAASNLQHQPQPPAPRPQMRGITELPPPSQLDIDWSPVLGNNERILKLGNLMVLSSPQSSVPGEGAGTPNEKPKFSRFFSSGTTKKRERLVLITSSARLIIAAAGGTEKKAKQEIELLRNGCQWKSFVDAKGLTGWYVDTRDKHLSFEDPRATPADPQGSHYSTAEWLESLERARELAFSQSHASSYSADDTVGDLASPSRVGTGGDLGEQPRQTRHTLRKNSELAGSGSPGGEEGKGRKRFSKRHSKSGLAAVF